MLRIMLKTPWHDVDFSSDFCRQWTTILFSREATPLRLSRRTVVGSIEPTPFSSVALDAMAPVLELRLDVFELLVVVFCANTGDRM